MIAHLQTLNTLLDEVTVKATRAHEATERLTASAGGAAATLSSLPSLLSLTNDQLTQSATRLDDLQNAVANHANLWNKAVSELIDAVKIGAVPIEQLISLYGDAQIGGQRLTEYLKGLDLTQYKDHIRELIQGLHEGSVEIAQVQDYLGKTQLLFAKQLTDIIDLFRKGAVTLKRVEEIVRDIKKAFPDSDFSDLAEALYDALKKS